MSDEKALYAAPKLTIHGDLGKITQQNSICNFQDTLGQVPAVVGSEFAPPICA